MSVHRRWFGGRAVLLGDAVHAMSPQLGQGVHSMSRMPGARGQMLRVLSGARKGWMGRMALPEGFG